MRGYSKNMKRMSNVAAYNDCRPRVIKTMNMKLRSQNPEFGGSTPEPMEEEAAEEEASYGDNWGPWTNEGIKD